jgi:hypothetical protein
MAERFLRATALAGDLHLIDFNYWEEWDLGRVRFRDEPEASWLKRIGGSEHRMIHTAAELDAAIEESVSERVFHLYISEGVVEEAKHRWEEMKQRRKR